MFNDLPLTFQAELSLMINKKVLEKVCDKLYTQLTSSEFELTIESTDRQTLFHHSLNIAGSSVQRS